MARQLAGTCDSPRIEIDYGGARILGSAAQGNRTVSEVGQIGAPMASRPLRLPLSGLGLCLILFVLMLANWSVPVLRTVSPTVSAGLAAIGCLLPWPAAICGFALRIGPMRWLLGASMAVVGLALLPFAAFAVSDARNYAEAGDRDGGFLVVSRAEFGPSSVVGYQTNGGATTDFGFIVQQERPLGMGLVLVRVLYSRYRSQGGTVQRVAPNRVRIMPEGAPDERTEIPVRPWVWF